MTAEGARNVRWGLILLPLGLLSGLGLSLFAFVPLVAGLFWKRANNTGAGLSIALGFAFWLGMEFIAPEGALPPQFAGFIAGVLGMVFGSLLARR